MGQTAYLRIDPDAQVIACLLTNAAESEAMYQQLFTEIFQAYAGVPMPRGPGPAAGPVTVDLHRHTGRYERTSRRFDVYAADGTLRMAAAWTGDRAKFSDATPEDLVLHPADASGDFFVCRSRDAGPWAPVRFGLIDGQVPYLFFGGRITPRSS